MNHYKQVINIFNNMVERNAIFEIEPQQEELTYEILKN